MSPREDGRARHQWQPKSSASKGLASSAFRLARSFTSTSPSRLRELLARASRPEVISFAIGLPAEDLFPVHELAQAQARVLSLSRSVLQYGVPCLRLKQQIVDLMKYRGVACNIEQVFLTSGAQQGMNLLARLFAEPGDEVLIEETVFEGIRLALEIQGARPLTVPTDMSTGLDVAAVRAALERGIRPRLLYSIPCGHNPLGVTLSSSKRQELIALAREGQFPVLEDDAYGFLFLDEMPVPPLRALEDRWVLYLGSFSKILAPSLRAGWLIVPEELIPKLSLLKHGTDLDTPSLSHYVISAYLETGSIAEHLETKRAEYRRRRDVLLECLAAWMPPGVRWTKPTAGMFIWMELPRSLNAITLLETGIETEGVAFSPGEAFAVGASPHANHCLRLCFTGCPSDQIAEGVRRLARAVARAVPRSPAASIPTLPARCGTSRA